MGRLIWTVRRGEVLYREGEWSNSGRTFMCSDDHYPKQLPAHRVWYGFNDAKAELVSQLHTKLRAARLEVERVEELFEAADTLEQKDAESALIEKGWEAPHG